MLGSPTDASALGSSHPLEDTAQVNFLLSHESPKSAEIEDERLQFEDHEQQTEEQEDSNTETENEEEDMHVVGRALHSAANDVAAATSPRYELARGIDERTFDGNSEDHTTNHDLSAALYSSSPSSLSSSAPTTTSTTTSSQESWGWSSLSRSMNFVPTRFYSSNTTGHDRPEDEQTALDTERALASKLSTATHLVVLAHGLHGGTLPPHQLALALFTNHACVLLSCSGPCRCWRPGARRWSSDRHLWRHSCCRTFSFPLSLSLSLKAMCSPSSRGHS